MANPREVSEAERAALRAEVAAEFPDDEMMREIHFIRALQAAQLRDFSAAERLEYLNRHLPRVTPSA
jgi:hypothetical protein